MASNKKNAFQWAAAGLLLSIMVLVLVFDGLKGGILIADEENIPVTADAVLRSIQDGDWTSLTAMVSGHPDLELQLPEQGTAERLIWNAYQESLQWELEEGYTVDGSRINQNVTVTCLDIAAVARILQEMSMECYEAIDAAAQQLLPIENSTMQKTISLTMVRENGSWVIIPNNALLALMSGFTAP